MHSMCIGKGFNTIFYQKKCKLNSLNVKFTLHLIVKLNCMKYLHAHKFKQIGWVIAPAGIIAWTLMQRGYIEKWITSIVSLREIELKASTYQIINTSVAITGFLACLIGLYLISFAKEKKEDEMINQTRLECFQFAALVQILMLISSFVVIFIIGEPGKEGFMLFFIGILLLFWVIYIARFNYIIYMKYKQ